MHAPDRHNGQDEETRLFVRPSLTWSSTLTAPGDNICSAFKTPVRVIEPNPDWRTTVGLRDYKNDWPWEPVTTAAGPKTTNRGPTASGQLPTSKIPL